MESEDIEEAAGPEHDHAPGRSITQIVRAVVGLGLLVALGVGAYLHYAGKVDRPAAPPSGAPTSVATSIPLVAQAEIESLTLAPDQLKKLSPDEARAWNAKLAFSSEAVQPAPPFRAPLADPADYGRALDCLTAAIYYEAGNETPAGKLAVAQVILNRVRHPVYPKTVCGVVFEGSDRASGCQFTFTCDGSLARRPSPAGWLAARTVAQATLNGLVLATVGAATHYHADYVAPYWAERLSKIVKVGTHIFYRFPGSWSAASSLVNRYAGAEPVIGKMAALSTPVDDPALDPATESGVPRLPSVETGELTPEPSLAVPPSGQPPILIARSPVRTDPGPAPADPPVEAHPVRQNPLTPAAQRPRPRIARPDSW